MDKRDDFASQAASLRAGVAGAVMIVVACFGAALAFSEPLCRGAGCWWSERRAQGQARRLFEGFRVLRL